MDTPNRSSSNATQIKPSLSVISKTAVWLAAFALLYLLRSFFLLIFLTFVFAYIQESAVRKLNRMFTSRNACVVIVGLAFITLIVGLLFMILPQFVKQGEMFANQMPSYIEKLDHHIIKLAADYPDVTQTLFGEKFFTSNGESINGRPSPFRTIVANIFNLGDEKVAKDQVKNYIFALRNFGGTLASIVGSFLLSLLFAFLILLDLPRLSKTVASLTTTKIGFVYNEVADTIKSFARVLGQALEAQFFIALCNTAFTAAGLFYLNLGEKVAFLSVIVFLCSFIPVAGVFISSVPICLFALVDSGVSTMFLAILLITVTHLIEAYILNPKIYGSHMHINPVIVLIILTIGGKLFHAWGLVLGVPVCTYIFGHAIQKQSQRKLQR